jgi:hypothetical protein
MLRSSRTRLDLAIVFAVAAAANFTYLVASNGDFYYPDSFTYLAPSRNLLQGLGFVTVPEVPEALRTPGYPLLLALFGARTLPVILLQHLLNAVLSAAVYLFVLRRIGSRFAALTASLLLALDTPTIHYANKILSETVFTAVLYVVFALALQSRRFVLLGLLTGLLVLVRPIALLYFVVLVIFFLYRGIPRRQVLAFLVASLLLPGGWAARNWFRSGVFTVSAIGGDNLLTYHAAGALAIERDGADFRADLQEEQNGLAEEADDEIQGELRIPDAQDLPDAVRASYYARIAWRVIRQHPAAFVRLTVRGFLVNLFDSDWEAMAIVSRLDPKLIRWTINAMTGAVFSFALIGILALRRRDRPLAMLIVLTVLYFLGMSAGGESEARFRVPVMPELAIAAAVGVESVISMRRRSVL